MSTKAAIRRPPGGSVRRAPRPLRGPVRAALRRALVQATAAPAPARCVAMRARRARVRNQGLRRPCGHRYASWQFRASIDDARLTRQRGRANARTPGRFEPLSRSPMQPTDRRLANAIRALAMDAVEAANSGHPGMPLGMADAATALFTRQLKFDASDPLWPDRDRFVLSAGHGSMLIYALLYLTGYERPTLDDIKRFRQLGSPPAGHPENFELPGVEVTTGPLGQGVAMD